MTHVKMGKGKYPDQTFASLVHLALGLTTKSVNRVQPTVINVTLMAAALLAKLNMLRI